MIKLHNDEAWSWMNESERKWDMLFMDPPDNLGLDYAGLPDNYDKRSEGSYYGWLWGLIFETIHAARVVWISYYHKHDLEIKRMVAKILKRVKPSWEARTFIWRFNFGQYRVSDCPNGYRPILRLSAPMVNWNTDSIRVESERMKLGDPRAAGPRVPDDVFEFPRVQGNNTERRAWIPTQHPEALIERIVKLSLPPSVEKPRILELFTGSGTMIRVVKRMNLGQTIFREIDLDTVELSKEYVQRLKEEHPEIEVSE